MALSRRLSASAILAAAVLSAASCARGEPGAQDGLRARIDDSAVTARRNSGQVAMSTSTSPRSCTEVAPAAWDALPLPPGDSLVGRQEVNRGARGMASRLHWTISPDSSALLVVDDPAGVENEPMLNWAVFGSERSHTMFTRDSLWSIEPSPDWSYLAYSRGALLGGGSEQRVGPARWDSVASEWRRQSHADPRITGDSLRAHVFPASGMAVVEGVAATFVVDVGSNAATTFAGFGGWRVRWSCDGGDLLLGDPPRRVQDDAPSEGEHRVSANSAELTNAPATSAAPWTEGPTLDVSTRVARGSSTPLVVRGRVISERKGRVIVRQRGPDGAETTRDIGPGIPLAATRGGRYVLAIGPRPGAKPHESPEQAIVYRIP
jgi:hypothetical protein